MSAPKDRPNPNVGQIKSGSDTPRPPKPPPEPLTEDTYPLARRTLREYNRTTDPATRIRLHKALVERFGCDVDALLYRVTVYSRRNGLIEESERAIEEARAQIEQQKAESQSQRPQRKAAAPKRGGRQPNGTLGVAQVAVTPAAKRGGK